MRKSVTKTIKATVAFAMAIGAGVGAAISSNRNTTRLNALTTGWDLTVASHTSSSADVVSWTSTYASMDLQKYNSSTNANNYLPGTNNHLRVYKDQKVLFTPASGYQINSVSITAVTSYVAGWTGGSKNNCSASSSGTTVTVTPTTKNAAFYLVISAAARATAVSIDYQTYVAPTSFTVTYYGNGNTGGSVPTDATSYSNGGTVTVKGNTGSLQKEIAGVSYVFNGWNTAADGSGTSRAVDSTFSISSNVSLYAQWAEPAADAGAVTYTLTNMTGFNSWNTSYSERTHTFTTAGVGTASVTLSAASKPSAGSAITDTPVMKNGTAVLTLNSETHYIKAVTFHAKQWGTKTKTITMYSSENKGTTWSSSLVTTSEVFITRISGLSSTVNSIRIEFGGTADNQIGLVDFVVTYDTLPTVQATSINILPASLSLLGGETGSFTPTLVGGTGNYEKTISWTSSHPAIISAPNNSESGEEISVTPEEVDVNTDVTLTGTVEVANGATASIIITVRPIKEISVESVSISGITNNSTLNGLNDNSVAVNRKIQFSANVNYYQGNAYMDGNNGISWSSSADGVATVNSTGLVTLCGNGTVSITATSSENNNKSASLTFTVSNINEQMGSENNHYTVAQARAAIDANENISNVYVDGIIYQIDLYNETYHSLTYWISDDGSNTNPIEVYSGKNAGGANFSSISDIEVGERAVVYGTLKLFNDVYEFDKNNQLVSHQAPTNETKIITSLNSSSSIALINGEENWDSGVAPETVTFADLGLVNDTQYSNPLGNGNFTVTFAGGSNDGKYFDTGAGIRTYGDGYFTIKSEKTITKIVLTFDGNNKPTANNVVDGGTYNKDTCIWTGSATSVKFTRPSGSGHWRLQSVKAVFGAIEGVDSVKLRLGGSISVESWNTINSLEGVNITDYGVMLFRTDEAHIGFAPTVKNAYRDHPTAITISRKNSSVPPTAENGYYSFVTKINITSTANYDMYFCARAFIVINNTDYYFIGEEMQETVKTVAASNNGTNLSSEALAYLAGN